jgi:hypothetical protein
VIAAVSIIEIFDCAQCYCIMLSCVTNDCVNDSVHDVDILRRVGLKCLPALHARMLIVFFCIASVDM